MKLIRTILKNPVAHCWTEEKSIKGKFCNVCRKKMHEVPGIRCEGGTFHNVFLKSDPVIAAIQMFIFLWILLITVYFQMRYK